jgi:hypothetical protein
MGTEVHAVSFAGRTKLAAGKHRSITTLNCRIAQHNFQIQVQTRKIKRCHAAPRIVQQSRDEFNDEISLQQMRD